MSLAHKLCPPVLEQSRQAISNVRVLMFCEIFACSLSILLASRAERTRDIFDPDSDTEEQRPLARRPTVRFRVEDDEESFGPSPPSSPDPIPSPVIQSPAFSAPPRRHRSQEAPTQAGPSSPSNCHGQNSPSAARHAAPAGTRKSSADDVWTFYSEMQQKNHCLFCQ